MIHHKEKAKELIDKFGDLAEDVVNEIIEILDYKGIYKLRKDPQWHWNKVKQEITEYRLIKSKSRNK